MDARAQARLLNRPRTLQRGEFRHYQPIRDVATNTGG
jgi:hypothetical protein